jgi:hypothetical protein
MPFYNVESLKIYIKQLIVNKKCCKEKLVWFARKKKKTVLNMAADAKA